MFADSRLKASAMVAASTVTTSAPAALAFPRFVICHGCGGRRWVIRKEVYEMPSGIAGVAWAKCRKCHHTFVRFIGEKEPARKLMERWLGIQER